MVEALKLAAGVEGDESKRRNVGELRAVPAECAALFGLLPGGESAQPAARLVFALRDREWASTARRSVA
jgi:hypothetical protein